MTLPLILLLVRKAKRKKLKLTVFMCPYKYGVTQPSISSSERRYPNMVLGKLVQVVKFSFSNRYID